MQTTSQRTIKKEVLQSTALNETKEILIYLPPGFQADQDYPVLILHDGTDYFNLGRIVTQAHTMIQNKEIKPVMLVSVPINKEIRTDTYAPKGSKHQAHIHMIVNELLPLLQDQYGVSPLSSTFVIGGSSLGATVSLQIALAYPELFHNILSQSGAFSEETKETILKSSSLSHFKIYQSIGKSETSVPTHLGKLNFLTRNREVFRLLEEKRANVQYVEAEGDHTWGFWQRDLTAALSFFFKY
ncbi:esterase family protein [Hazenella sp. IB182357]|uniref:Esterase family protein n=1 Tax=Polycladospora coralii TaxID=2771432 RepID=A0A926NBE0_9BACL|nr:alpha/beta hydrolase-fold protein [Polycladospora coralii]MBD1373448.1 esterase family protein [Polycladospora coralii]MBS7531225.1 esterase family protein [Polycladospora coralii]